MEGEGKGKKKKPTNKKEKKRKKVFVQKKKKKIKICRLSFITITIFFCTEKHLMGGNGAARPGSCAGGQGTAPPPQPQPRSLLQEGSPGKLLPMVFCSLWPESPSKGMQGTPFALSLGLVLLWL